MSRWSKIDRRIWGDAKFLRLKRLDPGGQALFLYLLTCPESTNVPGLFRAGEAALAESLGWTMKAFREAFREGFREGIWKACWKHRILWLPNSIKYNPPQSPNVVKSWSDNLDELPECELKDEGIWALKAFTEGLGEAFQEAFSEALRKTSRKQDQEQEKEQEQKKEQEVESKSLAVARIKMVEQVVGYYRSVWPSRGKHLQPGHRDWKLIEKSLRDGFSVDDCIQAINGNRIDTWHLERRAHTIEMIFRNASKIEQFIESARLGPTRELSNNERAMYEAMTDTEPHLFDH